MQFNQYNLYSMNAEFQDIKNKDILDGYINELRDFSEYDDIKNYITEHFGEISGTKWIEFPESNKQLYLCVDDEKVVV